MKQFASIILIMSVLTFQFSELLVYVSFKINQDYIAKNLCVEKDVEGSTCKGCCHLKKKVNEQQKQKDKLPLNESEKQNINFYAHICNLSMALHEEQVEYSIKKQPEYFQIFCYTIFHPPKIQR
ncbi:hypothetical protein [uncultured Draconibacterium sp.]|uniref:hypothetical protein n=1 Tax=uncultured Draconibacterium sp. TaxID=1573823 RepID=UPI003217D9C8